MFAIKLPTTAVSILMQKADTCRFLCFFNWTNKHKKICTFFFRHFGFYKRRFLYTPQRFKAATINQCYTRLIRYKICHQVVFTIIFIKMSKRNAIQITIIYFVYGRNKEIWKIGTSNLICLLCDVLKVLGQYLISTINSYE